METRFDISHRRDAKHSESGNSGVLDAADWLCLAATPAFAIMALASAVLGGGHAGSLCCEAQQMAGHHASSIDGMISMYLLMSAFHSAPWLRFFSGRRSSSRQTRVDSLDGRGADLGDQTLPASGRKIHERPVSGRGTDRGSKT